MYSGGDLVSWVSPDDNQFYILYRNLAAGDRVYVLYKPDPTEYGSASSIVIDAVVLV
jgi:hypothetical protein